MVFYFILFSLQTGSSFSETSGFIVFRSYDKSLLNNVYLILMSLSGAAIRTLCPTLVWYIICSITDKPVLLWIQRILYYSVGLQSV